mmetsp:Transcript_4572/g.15198  ORF Transcript_4572/g.15198 Transcript_4572/m.15198 type:complete len:128 (+) Transcript_4572:235-618(+)|eukprot:CAMPEP_0118896800 /NCGR_PEP_ID=MMETSP1166-20130328/4488_1 /TAXON_ID=1104430 /ORGANISM="Chrysoreinhardia sp, Strain CCMP3193" /LENGTH=127 /DNA_ID=CAMNT_0006835859 /DNA_START=198 /DNA_END=581 /DNA_ORIENTATION=+
MSEPSQFEFAAHLPGDLHRMAVRIDILAQRCGVVREDLLKAAHRDKGHCFAYEFEPVEQGCSRESRLEVVRCWRGVGGASWFRNSEAASKGSAAVGTKLASSHLSAKGLLRSRTPLFTSEDYSSTKK